MFRKIILALVAVLPLGSVSYAANYAQKNQSSSTDIREEFEFLLKNYQLPEKYYNYLYKNGYVDVEQFLAERNLDQYLKMLEEFESDMDGGIFQAAGATISIGGSY